MRWLVFVLALALLLAGLDTVELRAPGPGSAHLVDIAPGLSRWSIAESLAAQNAIRDPYSLMSWALLHPSAPWQAGTYRFDGGTSELQVAGRIRRGQVATVTLVIPEGFNRFDIARAVEQKGLGDAADFLAATADGSSVHDLDPLAPTLEGFLFPDTYRIAPDAPPSRIAQLMVARFRSAVSGSGLGWSRFGPRTPAQTTWIHAWVTIASLVEKETSVPAERPIVAGVFFNRLTRQLPLQCDPTVIYAALLAGDYRGQIRRADLERPSTFNTYKNLGLPPGPIANPGLAALRAAIHPYQSGYLYFVSDGAGGHRFAASLAEQNRNVRLYRDALAKRARNGGGQ